MKLVFDTNVILDVLAQRESFFDASLKALDFIGRKDVSGAITASMVTDIFFMYRKHQPDRAKCREAIRRLVNALEVLDTTRALCLAALDSPMSDFEDAVVAESAKLWAADYIVTRDTRDFSASPVEAIAPEELLHRFAN